MSVKDDVLSDFPQVYPGLERSEIEQLLTLLDQSASTEQGLSLSLATALKPLVPDIATRIASYKDGDIKELRGHAAGRCRAASAGLAVGWATAGARKHVQAGSRLPSPRTDVTRRRR